MGIFHTDVANRQSLATDVMEPVRPHVDAYVLNLIRKRRFGVKDFFENRDGGCRISSKLTHELANTMPEWARLVAPFAEMVWRYISKAADSTIQFQYPSAHAKLRRKATELTKPTPQVAAPQNEAPEVKRALPLAQVYNTCRHCGKQVMVRRRIYCDACYAEWRRSGNFTFLWKRTRESAPKTVTRICTPYGPRASPNALLSRLGSVADGSRRQTQIRYRGERCGRLPP